MCRIHSKQSQKTDRLIGVMGTSYGVGVTHFCILMANYYQSVCRRKVALIEWNEHLDFSKIEKLCVKSESGKRPFQLLGVDYFKFSGQEDLLLYFNMNYDVIIIDFGVVKKQQLDFMRCSCQFMISSLSEWQFHAFWDFIREINYSNMSWRNLIAFGNEETRVEVEKKLKISLKRIPLSEDAFTVNYKMMKWFEDIL